jgi:hypothetical protein
MSVVKISQLNPANSVRADDTFVLVQSGLTLKTTADLMFDAVTIDRDLADKTYVNLAIRSAINTIINGAPTILDTLNELAAAIDNDPNFAATIIAQINTKVSTADFNSLFDTQLATKTTSDLSEGTNKFYTDSRARSAITVEGAGSYNSSTGVITVVGGVTSVNGNSGAVTLNTDNITEGSNKYYTDAKVRNAISTFGSFLSYNNTTGVISYNLEPTFDAVYLDSAITANNQAVTKEYVDNAINSSSTPVSATTTLEGALYGRTDSTEYIAPLQYYPTTRELFWHYASSNAVNMPQAGYPNAIFLYNDFAENNFAYECSITAYPIGSDVYVRWAYHPSLATSQEIYLGKILAYKYNRYTLGQNGIIVSNPDGFDGVIGFTEYTPSRHRLTYGYVRIVVSFQDGSNVALGYEAMNRLNTGGKNVVLGYKAGQIITDGANLVVIGEGAEPSSETAQNEVTLGNSDITKTRLRGALEIGGSTGTVGQVLKSKGSGTAPEWFNISTVAGTGSYTDLINKPTIPTDISNLTDTTGLLATETITNIVTTNLLPDVTGTGNDFTGNNILAPGGTTTGLSNVATSGSYNDLKDKPTLFNGSYNSLTDKPNLELAPVARSGSYADLTTKPSSADITEGGSNLYFTNARARNAISASGGISYDNATGIITSPTRLVEKPITPAGVPFNRRGDYCIDGVDLYICNADYSDGNTSIWVKFSGSTSWS